MEFVAGLIIGISIGIILMSILSAKSYEKGYDDALQNMVKFIEEKEMENYNK